MAAVLPVMAGLTGGDTIFPVERWSGMIDISRTAAGTDRSCRLSKTELLIVGTLQTHGQQSGAQIVEASGLRSGTLYPALARLERRQIVASECAGIRPDDASTG